MKFHEKSNFGKKSPAKRSRRSSLVFTATSILLFFISASVAKEFKAPIFLEPISNETVPSGRDVRLACVVDHLGTYKLAWIQQDRSAILTVGKHVITRNPRIGVMHDEHRTWYLIIRNVKPGDAGTYMCQINTEPVTSQIGVVDVVVPPYIKDEMTSKDVRLHEGSSVNLACSSRGSPIPTVKWKREDGRPIRINSTRTMEEVSGPILRLQHLTRSDMGAYLCIASNGVPPSVSKRIQVQVKFRPTVYAPHQLFGVILGQDATLECYVEAWPLSLNYWKRPKGFEILHTDEKYNVTTELGSQPYKTRMILNIKNFSVEDVGDYNCISNNSQGGAEQVIRVSASTAIITNQNLIEKNHNNPKDPPLTSGKPVLKPVNWSKESSFDEKEHLFNRKKDQIMESVVTNPKDHSRGNSFFPLNNIEETEASSSAGSLDHFYFRQGSLVTSLESLAFFSRIGEYFYGNRRNDIPLKESREEEDLVPKQNCNTIIEYDQWLQRTGNIVYENHRKRTRYQHNNSKRFKTVLSSQLPQTVTLNNKNSSFVPITATPKNTFQHRIQIGIEGEKVTKINQTSLKILSTMFSLTRKQLTELIESATRVILWWHLLRFLINLTTSIG